MKLLTFALFVLLMASPSYSQDSASTPQTPGKVEVVKPEDLKKEQEQPAPAKAEKTETVPGAIVFVRPYPKSGSILSEADYGAFQTQKFSWDSAEFRGKGVKSGGNPFVVEVQTYLLAREAGLYQFAIDTGYDGNGPVPQAILAVIKLEGNELVNDSKPLSGQSKLDTRTVGAAKLTPGLYALQMISGIKLDSVNKEHFTFTILMKGPGDLNFRTPRPDELVLKK